MRVAWLQTYLSTLDNGHSSIFLVRQFLRLNVKLLLFKVKTEKVNKKKIIIYFEFLHTFVQMTRSTTYSDILQIIQWISEKGLTSFAGDEHIASIVLIMVPRYFTLYP